MSFHNPALQTDLYELTMAAGYYHAGMTELRASCEVFVRHLPRGRDWILAAGLPGVLEELSHLRFDEDDVRWLRELPALREGMTPGFEDYLRGFRFTGDVHAVPEGTPIFGYEPMLRVEAPVIEAQVVETFLLSALDHATRVATKAARIVEAARPAKVVEFGARRIHPDAAVDAARSAYLAGCAGTSDLAAGKRFGIPVFGTAAHMWTMSHRTELEAFEHYVHAFPTTATLLIDTYDTLEGARRAAKAGGSELRGVRLDSGDMLQLSRGVRRILDEAGLEHTRIVASGDLNEYRIRKLLQEGAPIDTFGVGTELVIGPDAPALGLLYKLVSIGEGAQERGICKFSEGKETLPGRKQVYRFRDSQGRMTRDLLALEGEPPPEGAEALLQPVMRKGRILHCPALHEARAHARAQVASLPPELRHFETPPPKAYPVQRSRLLQALFERLRREYVPGTEAAPSPAAQGEVPLQR